MADVNMVYAVCGGTSDANGFYQNDIAYFNHTSSNGYTISYSAGYWYLKNASSNNLYRFSAASDAVDPLSETGWTIVNGTSPTIKTFDATNISVVDSNNNYVFGKVSVNGSSLSAANGTYTRDPNNTYIWINNTDSNYTIQPYTNSAYPAIYSGPVPIFYAGDGPQAGPGNKHPVSTSWETTGNAGGYSAPTSSYYITTDICSTSTSSNFYVRKNSNNQPFIRYHNGQGYIRKS